MAEQEVLNTLLGVTNEAQATREEAERRLQQYAHQPGYGGILCRIMSNQEVPLHLRQVLLFCKISLMRISWLA